MPEVSRFYGIVVKIYLIGKEHNPPHVHFIKGIGWVPMICGL